jgi:hypothetical protein
MANEVYHYFNAQAYALSAQLQTPFEAQIPPQAYAKLEGDSRKILPEGEETKKPREKKPPENYFSEHYENYRHETIFSFSAAHTQVSGHKSRKHKEAFVTLATSEVQNLNVLNVITADRVVAQISTTHFPYQYSPHVTFLGTQFENLRIAGHKVEPALNLDFVGTRPEGKDAIYPAKGTGLMASVKSQYQRLEKKLGAFKSQLEQEHMARLNPEDSWLSKQYHYLLDFKDNELPEIPKEAAQKDAKPANANGGRRDSVTCSLVERMKVENVETQGEDPIVIFPPARSLGHVIHVKDFGTIFLAELTVKHNVFHLTMIRVELGCALDGDGSMASCTVNGRGHP